MLELYKEWLKYSKAHLIRESHYFRNLAKANISVLLILIWEMVNEKQAIGLGMEISAQIQKIFDIPKEADEALLVANRELNKRFGKIVGDNIRGVTEKLEQEMQDESVDLLSSLDPTTLPKA
jgi:hypothetical protein